MTLTHDDEALIASTHVFTPGMCYVVSTINRQSSAMLSDAVYAETLVWTTASDGKFWNIVHQGEASSGSIRTHMAFVQYIHDHGKPPSNEEDEP